MTVEEMVSVPAGEDLSLPESGGWEDFPEFEFTPRVTPGVVTYRYEYKETREKATKAGVPFKVVVFTAHVLTDALPPARLIGIEPGTEVAVNFNEVSSANFATKDKKGREVEISTAALLFRALGLDKRFPQVSPADGAAIVAYLEQASGLMAEGVLAWRAGAKLEDGSYEVFSTHPRKNKKDPARAEKPWPIGNPRPVSVTFSNGESKVGQERLVRSSPLKSATA